MAPPTREAEFEPHDSLSRAITVGTITGIAGLTVAATRNALEVNNVGPWHTFRQGGHLIFNMGATGVVYEFTHCAAANLREKNDHWNHVLAGLLGGAVFGLGSPVRSMPRIVGYSAFFAAIMGSWEAGNTLLSGRNNMTTDEKYEMREMERTRYRQPVEETVAYMGLGREIRPPGYEEMRRKKLQEKYGIKVETFSANPDDYPESK